MTEPDNIDLRQVHPFFNLINQVGLVAEQNDLYFISLMSALAMPDICGALESSNGLATGPKYKSWFDKWVSPKYQIQGKPSFTGHDCYMLRCAALHQGRLTHPQSANKGVIFIKPGASNNKFHNNLLNGYLNIDIYDFCFDITQATTDWFEAVVGTDPFEENFSKSMQVHFNGFGPIQGVSVIA